LPARESTRAKPFKQSSANPQVNAFVSYTRKIGRYGFRTQVNVNNLFNKYAVDLRPSGSTGFTRPEDVSATFVGEPRQIIWTNTFSF
jgi:outer membrane receptor protein involved in Fe transport